MRKITLRQALLAHDFTEEHIGKIEFSIERTICVTQRCTATTNNVLPTETFMGDYVVEDFGDIDAWISTIDLEDCETASGHLIGDFLSGITQDSRVSLQSHLHDVVNHADDERPLLLDLDFEVEMED